MTATATICALIPMGLGLTGGGAFISQPLAVVVIGGLISSTVLTLLLVPVLYTLVERRGEKKRLRARETDDTAEIPRRHPPEVIALSQASARTAPSGRRSERTRSSFASAGRRRSDR